MKALRRLLLVVVAAALPLVSMAQEAPKPPVVSWYGILHTGMFFNGGTFNAQDAAYQGLQTTNTGGSTYFSARQSRAGMKLNLGDDNALGAAITGTLEFDFMGSNTATSSVGAYNPNIRLRHAWMNAAWKTGLGDLSLTLGQDWDFVNNLNPDSIAYLANPMFGQSGNLFRRAPQARVDYFSGGDIGGGVQLAVMSPVDSNSASIDNGLGNQSRSPAYMGRAYVTVKGDIGGTIGVGYETEKRRYIYVAATGDRKDATTSLLGIDADLNLTQFLQVKGEYFKDDGMADAMAGMTANGTVKTITFTGTTAANGASYVVKSDGYWAQAIVKPIPLIFITVGMGQSKIDQPSLDAANGAAAIGPTDRLENDSTSVGLILNVSKAWKLGLDYYMTTSKYKGGTGTDLRPSKVDIQQIALASQLRF
jgi:hypothetical protein